MSDRDTAETPSPSIANRGRARIGIPALDEIIGGGLPRDRLYLVDGEPGTGKTTIAMHFLLEGREHDERVLYVTLSETAEELSAAAASHGWSLDGIGVLELASMQDETKDEAYTLFHPAEVELQQTIDAVLAQVEKHRPTRMEPLMSNSAAARAAPAATARRDGSVNDHR